MAEHYAILPCNGLDKCAGVISRELAIQLTGNADSVILCPVFFRVSPEKYKKLIVKHPLFIIDGCHTRCATKLAIENNLKISKKITITEEAKNFNIELKSSLKLSENEYALIEIILSGLNKTEDNIEKFSTDEIIQLKFDYELYHHGKFIFRVPRNPGFFFNENDCWALVTGKRARIGVTDFVQQNLSDILYCTLPELGSEIDQFGEAGEIESTKAIFEIISPVSGKVVATNERLLQQPDLINENPYETGWIAEVELYDFDSDKELLLEFTDYFEIMQKKIAESNG